MLASLLWTLRQRRYAAMAAMMFVIALGCVAAGTWQIQRFEQSVHDNRALDHNAHAAATPLTAALVPFVGAAPAPGRDAIRYRTVTVTGTYLPDTQYLSGKIVNNVGGYYVLTGLRTSDGVALIVRGFIADDGHGSPEPVPTAPTGIATVTGRLQTPSSSTDPAKQAARLGLPVYDASISLLANQPGTAGVVVLPKPNLSNPAGGAYEAQHFAYIIQWYLFALLALISPFAMARKEVREARLQFLGIDEREAEFGLEPAPVLELGASGSGAELVARPDGTVVTRDAAVSPAYKRAERLADRYGRSLHMDGVPTVDPTIGAVASGRAGGLPETSGGPHRSPDAYHGSYNDYLWQLGLADGDSPDVDAAPPATDPPTSIEPVAIEVEQPAE
jgi:cytochrome oxidase assembly protein ShyY1